MNKNIVETDEMKSNITYDLYSSAMDGMMGVWRVELFFDHSYINESNYFLNTNNSGLFRADNTRVVDLFPYENIKIPSISLTKISNTPIIFHYINENSLIFLGQRNSKASAVTLKFYYGNTKEEEVETKEKNYVDKNDDSITQIVNKNSLKDKDNSAKSEKNKKEERQDSNVTTSNNSVKKEIKK